MGSISILNSELKSIVSVSCSEKMQPIPGSDERDDVPLSLEVEVEVLAS